METKKLILAKSLKCPKWSHAVCPIEKGTEVEVEIHTFENVYTVKHPKLIGIYIQADKSYFVDTRIKSDVKVGDVFWFSSVYSHKVWSDVITKITPRFAYFEKHNSKIGVYKINLFDLNILGIVCCEISIQEEVGKNVWGAVHGDKVNISKNKREVQIEVLTCIKKLKIDKEKVIEKLATEHTNKLNEYAQLETEEVEMLKEIEKN